MPGINEPERVRNLLQGRANLEFWKTYNVNELAPYFNELNQRSIELVNAMKEVADSLSQQQNDSIEKTASLQLTDTSVTPSLQLRSTDEEGEEKPIITKSFIEYFHQPYFAMSGATGPVVGTVAKTDTAAVNFLLNKFKDVFPADVQFRWGFKPVDVHETYFELYVLKGDGPRRGPALDGDVVVNARADQGQQGSGWEVSMTMNSAGASRWATITGAEKGKSIAIVLDGYVYSAPRVNDRIEGGRSSITGNFTHEEAEDLANVLK